MQWRMPILVILLQMSLLWIFWAGKLSIFSALLQRDVLLSSILVHVPDLHLCQCWRNSAKCRLNTPTALILPQSTLRRHILARRQTSRVSWEITKQLQKVTLSFLSVSVFQSSLKAKSIHIELAIFFLPWILPFRKYFHCYPQKYWRKNKSK